MPEKARRSTVTLPLPRPYLNRLHGVTQALGMSTQQFVRRALEAALLRGLERGEIPPEHNQAVLEIVAIGETIQCRKPRRAAAS